MNNAICLITREPDLNWISFLKDFVKYDIYIVYDSCSDINLLNKYIEKYPSIKFITFDNDKCIEEGFQNSSHMENSSLIFNRVIAWDKGLYYFSRLETKYDNVWFFEDDVFFYNEKTIEKIDNEYIDSDIVCTAKNPEPSGDEWRWFWPAIHINFPGPYFHSLICSVRLSRTLLYHINDYIHKNKTLFFIEAMFPTIATHHNLKYDMCKKLNSHWRKTWDMSELNEDDICHPLKDTESHQNIRNIISERNKNL